LQETIKTLYVGRLRNEFDESSGSDITS